MFPTFGRYLRDAVKYIHQHRSAALQATILSVVLLLIVSYFTVPPTELNPYVFFRRSSVQKRLYRTVLQDTRKLEDLGVEVSGVTLSKHCFRGGGTTWKDKTPYAWKCEIVYHLEFKTPKSIVNLGKTFENPPLSVSSIEKYLSFQKESHVPVEEYSNFLVYDDTRAAVVLGSAYVVRPNPFYFLP